MNIATATAALNAYTADPTEYNRSELSELGVNSLREAGKANMDLLHEEAARCRKAGITANADGLVPYLRVRRVGSSHLLRRSTKVAVFCTLVAHRLI